MQAFRRIPTQCPQSHISDDHILRQITAPIRKPKGFRIIGYGPPGAIIAACAKQGIGQICAITASVHLERTAQRPRDGAQKRQIKTGIRRLSRNMAVQGSSSAMNHVTVNFSGVEAAPKTDHHRPQAAIPDDQV